GVEALLPRLARDDVGCLRGGDWETGIDRRRRRAAGNAMAGLGDYNGGGHEAILVDGVARGLMPRVASDGVRGFENPAARAPRGAVGIAIVLSRAQHGE